MFRDVFTGLAQLFEAASEALSKHAWEGEENPYADRVGRVFGPRPGLYGLVGRRSMPSPAGRDAAGEAWLAGSSWAISAAGKIHRDRAGMEARLTSADGFAHVQDLAETDLLLASDYAGNEGGFAAAVARLGSPLASSFIWTRPAPMRRGRER